MPQSSESLPLPIICMVARTGTNGLPRLLDRVASAARAGVDLIQIREPDRDAAGLLRLARGAVRLADGLPTRVVINERLDVALAAGADGVHLRGSSYPAAAVRSLAPRPFLVGRSVHSADEAADAEAAGGCDYLVFGTVFPSAGKPPDHPVAGIEALARVCARVRLPVVAIGGVTPRTAGPAYRAGAAGVAAIGIFEQGDVAGVVADLRLALAG